MHTCASQGTILKSKITVQTINVLLKLTLLFFCSFKTHGSAGGGLSKRSWAGPNLLDFLSLRENPTRILTIDLNLRSPLICAHNSYRYEKILVKIDAAKLEREKKNSVKLKDEVI